MRHLAAASEASPVRSTHARATVLTRSVVSMGEAAREPAREGPGNDRPACAFQLRRGPLDSPRWLA